MFYDSHHLNDYIKKKKYLVGSIWVLYMFITHKNQWTKLL